MQSPGKFLSLNKRKVTAWALAVLLLFVLYKKCSVNSKSRERLKWSTHEGQGLYTETFCVFGQGAYGADLDAVWLTDSANFRIWLGTFDETDEGIQVTHRNDTILIRHFGNGENGQPKPDMVDTFRFSALKKLNNLNDY
ncbi:MAG: hypothetical protein JST26_13225 [Bacteroidetes bacterium]|nr:hypothetical protein [Bacteroidota bacterium]